MSTEAIWLIRVGGRGWGGGGGGGGEGAVRGGGGRERMSSSSASFDPERQRRMWTTARTTAMLRQWGPRHCVATSILRDCCFNCCAKQSRKDNVRSSAVEKQLEAKGGATF